MLSVFPELFNYSQIAPLLLRLSLGIVLIRIGYLTIFKTITKKEKFVGGIQVIASVFLFLGLFTQIASLLAIATVFNVNQKALKLMIFVVALSLMLLGPGLFSFDLPL